MNKKQANELSVQELLLKIKNFWHFLLAQFWKILLAGFLGAILFFCYAFIQPITYTAGLTFVLDESKSSNNNGLASLAGQFGMDLGNSGGGGLLAGDNIYLYFKSESLIKDVLLSVYDSTHNKSLADAYVEMYDFNEQWAKNEKIKKVILFSPSLSISQTTRLEDSLLRSLSYMLIKQCFFDKADKKGSFLKLEVTLKDEKLAKIFCERLLQRAVQKYIDIKVGRQRYSFNKLQERADSISKLLKQQTFSQAELQTEN